MRMKIKTKGQKFDITPSKEEEILKTIKENKIFQDDLKMFKKAMKE